MAKYTQELFDKICESVATSSDGLTKICKNHGISRSNFMLWVEKTTENQDKYARAKEMQMDFMAEQIIEIADNDSGDVKITEGGNVVQNSEFINRSRLRVDARKWLMAKLHPRKYGEKLDITTGGEAISQTFFTLPDGTKLPI